MVAVPLSATRETPSRRQLCPEVETVSRNGVRVIHMHPQGHVPRSTTESKPVKVVCGSGMLSEDNSYDSWTQIRRSDRSLLSHLLGNEIEELVTKKNELKH